MFYFETLSTFLEWVVTTRVGSGHICHYVDDFLFIGRANAKGSQSCHGMLSSFVAMCKDLGVPLAEDKTVNPTTKLTVPKDKLPVLNAKISAALTSNKITLRELQSLIGSLSIVCRAVSPGRAFLRRLIDLLLSVKKPWYLLIRLTIRAKEDLHMWQVFLCNFNGRTIIPEQFWLLNDDVQLYTDSSG